jgi:hypothetical protein
MSTIKTFGPVDERSLKQLERCMEAGDAEFGVLCADHHPGYSQPIGGGIAYEGFVSPSGVGYDIGCGNKAARTELTRRDLDTLGGVESIMREIFRRISFGIGVSAQERVDHPVLEKIRKASLSRSGRSPSWRPRSSARSARATTTSTCWRTRRAGSGSASTSARAASATRRRPGSSRWRRG